jgi:hypothetical protein
MSTAIDRDAVRVVALWDWAHFPTQDYPGVSLKVRVNPSGVVWEDFRQGGFHADERERALLDSLDVVIGQSGTSEGDRAAYAARRDALQRTIAERVARMGDALVALFGETEPLEVETEDGPVTLDFSTPEAAIATAEDDRLPDEITYWIVQLPTAIIERRRSWIKDNLSKSFGRPS